MSKIQRDKKTALDYVDENVQRLSGFQMEIWRYAEKEYKASTRAYSPHLFSDKLLSEASSIP